MFARVAQMLEHHRNLRKKHFRFGLPKVLVHRLKKSFHFGFIQDVFFQAAQPLDSFPGSRPVELGRMALLKFKNPCDFRLNSFFG